MRPEKMALWNEFLPSQVRVEPTTATAKPTTADHDTADDNKGMKPHKNDVREHKTSAKLLGHLMTS